MGSDSNSSRIPKLRFPGFTGEWEEKKLGDILDYEQPTPYLVASDLYQKQGTPVLTAGKTFILGYTDETVGVYDKVPVIIFDDFVTESKYVTFPFKAKSSAMKMLSLKNKTDNLYFTYVSMLLNQKPVGDHKRHWISETSQIQVLVPPTPAEQQKIASFLSEIDDQIASQGQKVDALKEKKKGLMQQLFPQAGETTPKRRFPGFEGEWEEKNLEEFGQIITGSTPSRQNKKYWGGEFCWISAQDMKVKYIYDTKEKVTNEGKKQCRILPKNSVLVTCIASIGLNAITKVDCATNQQINAIITNNETIAEFLYQSMENSIYKLKAMAGQTAVPIINKQQFSNFSIFVPQSSAEIGKIVGCLSTLDDTITAESDKLEVLKNHKKGLMQQLFPQPIK